MSEEILINVTPQETRIAYVENGVLQEINIERARARGMVGNIYQGRVSRVLPGMEAAFVDIGLERAAFLHVSDIELKPEEKETGVESRPRLIYDLLRTGQNLMVQVIKDPLGTKGARLTTEITIPSRYLVYVPNGRNIGVSSRVEVGAERDRLKTILGDLMNESREQQNETEIGGFILRTAAEGIDTESLRQDYLFLRRLWASVQERQAQINGVGLVFDDLPIALRTLRDVLGRYVEKIRIDSRETYHRAIQFAQEMVPDILPILEHYPGERPLFDMHNIELEIANALERRVPLKSGGYIIIDQTEAMTTIDVNTGGFVGSKNLEETIFKTNLEAASAIARQLRLRNLGGIIILDFIDMIEPDHRLAVQETLKRALENDHARTKVCEVSGLGLVEMTRKRTRESLEHILCEVCPTCSGRGTVKTAETVCYEIFREVTREARQYNAKQMLVIAASLVVDRLREEDSTSLAELQEFIGVPLRLQTDVHYLPEQYDIVLM
ncbi:MAG: ribonuclease E/G [Halothiobacillus sp. 24-54-40]|jgi:ribonuclease G|nr:ribonuclease G [Halothiobacillaceae bacterium]OYY41942.1 MAG: ribonuclease E/G [Halothiobacillus sp. 35-54-62]OYZ87586.1 MAG: ribonuclease E/G [Halothiobacillus sp. 24-54-40]OZA81196.1 MAG: ribonuclease E/G [Halothiobacillus sp. 39-53-45]HQS02428.1 ribonuclease G [Halothiobacillus sp.]